MLKNINRRIVLFSSVFIVFSILFIILNFLSGSEYVADDLNVIKMLSLCGLLIFSFFQLIVSIFFRIKKYDNVYVINILLTVTFFLSALPIGIFLFISKNIPQYFFAIYFWGMVIIFIFTFINTKVIKNNIFNFFGLPVLIYIILFSGMINYKVNTDTDAFPPYIKFSKLFSEAETIQVTNEECYVGTLGSLFKYNVWFNADDNNFYYYKYLQFKSESDSLINKIKKKYVPINTSKTSKDAVTLYMDNNDGYYMEFEDTIIVLITNAEINNDLLFSALE